MQQWHMGSLQCQDDYFKLVLKEFWFLTGWPLWFWQSTWPLKLLVILWMTSFHRASAFNHFVSVAFVRCCLIRRCWIKSQNTDVSWPSLTGWKIVFPGSKWGRVHKPFAEPLEPCPGGGASAESGLVGTSQRNRLWPSREDPARVSVQTLPLLRFPWWHGLPCDFGGFRLWSIKSNVLGWVPWTVETLKLLGTGFKGNLWWWGRVTRAR